MTDHDQIQMKHEERRVTDPELIKRCLDLNNVCTVALYDEPFPYIVPMNYGYTWDDQLVIYLHMASEGHRVDLIRKNPRAAFNTNVFLDRAGYKRYRKEDHDYRSVSVFGKLEIIGRDDPEALKKAMNAICSPTNRPVLEKAPMNKNMLVVKLIAEYVTAKAQYPLYTPEEVEMPGLEKEEA